MSSYRFNEKKTIYFSVSFIIEYVFTQKSIIHIDETFLDMLKSFYIFAILQRKIFLTCKHSFQK